MTTATSAMGELLYDERPTIKEVVEYGTKFSDFIEGKPVGPSGARFDFHFDNEIRGRLTGKVKGIAAIIAKPDGTNTADIHGTLTTDDGENILVKALLYLSFGPEPGAMHGKGTVRFFTNSEKYQWTNSTIGVVNGGGNPLKGEAAVKVYSLGE